MRTGFHGFLGRIPRNRSFYPGVVFVGGHKGVWFDNYDLSTLFQDSAGTVPVTADGDPIGLQLDKSGNGYHRFQEISARRPTWRSSGGLCWIQYDGVDDALIVAGPVDFTATRFISVFASVRNVRNSTAIYVELSANTNSNNGGFFLTLPESSSRRAGLAFRSGAGVANNVDEGPTLIAPFKRSLTAYYDMDKGNAAEALRLRVNTIPLAMFSTVTDLPGTGAFGSYPLYFGARSGTAFRFQGNDYGTLIVGRAVSSDEQEALESYFLEKSGEAA